MQSLERIHESIYARHIFNAFFQKKPYFYYVKVRVKILEVDKAFPLLLYMLYDIIYKILNILSSICSLTVAQVWISLP